jgi:ankyrin repeat protein
MAPIIPPLTAPPWSDTHFIMQGDSQSTSSPFREQLFRAVRLNLPIEVMRLLDEGAEVNCIDHHGNTPLHIAVGRGNEEITKILLQNGADATRRNFNFRTPVEVAERCGREEITRLLLGDAGTAQQGNSARQILAGRVKTRNLMRQR